MLQPPVLDSRSLSGFLISRESRQPDHSGQRAGRVSSRSERPITRPVDPRWQPDRSWMSTSFQETVAIHNYDWESPVSSGGVIGAEPEFRDRLVRPSPLDLKGPLLSLLLPNHVIEFKHASQSCENLLIVFDLSMPNRVNQLEHLAGLLCMPSSKYARNFPRGHTAQDCLASSTDSSRLVWRTSLTRVATCLPFRPIAAPSTSGLNS